MLSCRWPSVLTHWVLWLVSQEEWTLPAGIRVGGPGLLPSVQSHNNVGRDGRNVRITMWSLSIEIISKYVFSRASVLKVCVLPNKPPRMSWVISCKLFNFLSLNFLSVEGDHKNKVFREVQGWITRREGLSLSPRLGLYRIQTHLGLPSGKSPFTRGFQ